MGTILPNKEKTVAFNITKLYKHKNLWDASECACHIGKRGDEQNNRNKAQCDIATFKSTSFSYFTRPHPTTLT